MSDALSHHGRMMGWRIGLAALLLASCSWDAASTYELPYGPLPFAPAEARVEGGDLLPPDALTGSAACGACHAEIAAQWEGSLHRAAASDPFQRFAIDRAAEDYGVAATRLCEACHDPGRLLSGGVDRGAPANPASRREGVSCLACHLVTATHASDQTGAIANASFTVSPLPREVLIPSASASNDDLRRHGQALRRPFLSENRFCDSCHRFFVPTQMGGPPPGRLRLQSAEAEGTPYGDPSHPGYKSCVDCHMPLIPGDDPAAKDGRIHDHRSLGANLFVPSLEGNTAHAEATRAFRCAGAVTLEVGDLARTAAGGLSLPVVLRNERNGHDFPSGATDISETWLELTLEDATGSVVYESPGLDSERYLSPDAPTLSTVVWLANGELDDMHDLFSQVDRPLHGRVRAGGSAELRFAPTLPPDAAPPLRARVRLRARHGNERWNRWTFNWAPVEVAVADLAEVERALETVPPAPEPPPPASPPPAPEGMVYVPGGTYVVGADPKVDPQAAFDEYPPHRVTLKPFFLDRVPVTNAAYAEAVRKGVVPAPPPNQAPPLDRHSWRDDQPPLGLDDHPVVLETAPEAILYCKALGKRLPTEAEWEVAARGSDGRRYPWGDEFDPAICNNTKSGRFHSIPVGIHPANASPFGALDLGCNVVEWTGTRYRAYPKVRYNDNRDMWWNSYSRDIQVTRGASFEMLPWRARASHRGHDEDFARKLIGFRCAADAPVEGAGATTEARP
jgi:formylglycine-generating enzyme required for sulfatase activity